MGVVVLILVKVKKKRKVILYSIVNNSNELIDEGCCENLSLITDKYYDIKDKYGSENVRMIFV